MPRSSGAAPHMYVYALRDSWRIGTTLGGSDCLLKNEDAKEFPYQVTRPYQDQRGRGMSGVAVMSSARPLVVPDDDQLTTASATATATPRAAALRSATAEAVTVAVSLAVGMLNIP